MVRTHGIVYGSVDCEAFAEVVPELIGSRKCLPMAFTAESLPAQGQ